VIDCDISPDSNPRMVKLSRKIVRKTERQVCQFDETVFRCFFLVL
jgi:hypothetical protein